MPTMLTDGQRDEIVEAASNAQRRQEHRTYRAIVVGFAIAALILFVFGFWATYRIETLIDDVEDSIALNREEGARRDALIQRILENQQKLIVAQERNTHRILRAQEQRANDFERRVTRDLASIQTRLEVATSPSGGG